MGRPRAMSASNKKLLNKEKVSFFPQIPEVQPMTTPKKSRTKKYALATPNIIGNIHETPETERNSKKHEIVSSNPPKPPKNFLAAEGFGSRQRSLSLGSHARKNARFAPPSLAAPNPDWFDSNPTLDDQESELNRYLDKFQISDAEDIKHNAHLFVGIPYIHSGKLVVNRATQTANSDQKKEENPAMVRRVVSLDTESASKQKKEKKSKSNELRMTMLYDRQKTRGNSIFSSSDDTLSTTITSPPPFKKTARTHSEEVNFSNLICIIICIF